MCHFTGFRIIFLVFISLDSHIVVELEMAILIGLSIATIYVDIEQ